MIRVIYSELDGPEGLTLRLEASGHAGYAPAGQDIVCAGASTLMQALVSLLAGEKTARSDAWDELEGPRLAVTAAAPQEPWVEGAFELAKAGFALLAERYPDNLRFADLSRRGEAAMMDLQLFAEGSETGGAGSAPALSEAQARQAVASGTLKPGRFELPGDVSSQFITGLLYALPLVEGESAYAKLKHESGVHRVQRVPETESGGRIHTSTCTVAVLPQVDEVEFQLNPADLRIDTFRASGAGGQHINKTESAIRVTHLPTGTVVECQDQRSQYKNKDRALSILRARLYEQAIQEQAQAVAGQRRSQVGSGMRNERIRTYNFPQGRVTDHRIGLTLYKLDAVMNGELEELVEGLSLAEQRERLKRSEDG